MKKANYTCNFNLDDCIKSIGMDECGKVQQYVTEQFKQNVFPYVPFDEAGVREGPGRLAESAHNESSEDEKKDHLIDQSKIENGTDVVWNTPYARRLYYHPEYNYQGAPMRGGYWADRYMQNGGQQEIEDGVRNLVKRLH